MKLIEKLAKQASEHMENDTQLMEYRDVYECGYEAGFRKALEMAQQLAANERRAIELISPLERFICHECGTLSHDSVAQAIGRIGEIDA